jgi:hypothetical protein
MNDRRLEALLTDWYARATSAAPEPLRGAVMGVPDLAEGVGDRSRPWSRVPAPHVTSPSVRFALAAFAIVIIAVVGFNLMPTPGGIVGSGSPPSPGSSPSASRSVLPSPSPSWFGAYPPPIGYVSTDRHAVVADGVALSFAMTQVDWESHEYYLSKSDRGSQGAEGIILWAGFPVSDRYEPCFDLLGRSDDPSVDDLAFAVSTVAGTDDIVGPLDVTVGGRAAKFVSFFVSYRALDNLRVCSPGFFYSWETGNLGAMWDYWLPGDTVRVWIVEVDGRILIIEGATHWNAGPELEQEIQQIIDSIRFE